MDQENNNYGRDQNVTNIGHVENLLIEESLPALPPLDSSYRLTNYALTFFSLSGNLIAWIFLGLFAKAEFPIDYVWKLLIACLRGPKYFSKVLNKEQLKLRDIQESILRAREKFRQENLRLNELNKQESRVEVLEKSIEQLYKEIEDKDASISRILSRLEYQKNLVQIDLEPLKQRLDPRLYKLERLLQVLLDGKSSIEKDFERIEAILNYLSDKYKIRSQNPTTHLVENFLQELNNDIVASSSSMGHSRLSTLKRILYILQWTYSVRVNSYSPDSSLVDSEFESLDDKNTEQTELLNNQESGEQIVLDRKAWIDLLNKQIELLLNQTTGISQDSISRLNEGINREWIKKVSVYGLNHQGLARAELAVAIDWKKQEISFWDISNSQPLNLNESIVEFKRFISTNALTLTWVVTPTDSESSNLLDQLGFSSCDSPKWATEGRSSRGLISEVLRFFGVEKFPKLSVELNFGSPNSRIPLPPINNSYISSGGCAFVFLCVASLFIFVSISSVNLKPNLTQQEQVYWDDLHRAIVVWDIQTSQRSLIPLNSSQDTCVAKFASTLKASLNSKGAQGLQDVNPIKRYLNEQHNCTFEIIPYEFSP